MGSEPLRIEVEIEGAGEGEAVELIDAFVYAAESHGFAAMAFRSGPRVEADALREALREIMFAGCRHVWDDECARCHTFEPVKDIARAALGASEAPQEQGR